jgi:hypothetical protein
MRNVEARRSHRQLAVKTLTVRHRETPDRDDKQSEGLLVMRWIAVNITADESYADLCRVLNGEKLFGTNELRKAKEQG